MYVSVSEHSNVQLMIVILHLFFFKFSAIKIVPAGISKAVKKLIQNKVPNLSQYQEVDDFLHKSGNLSESEVELDSAANTIVLPQPISSRGNITSEKSAIR